MGKLFSEIADLPEDWPASLFKKPDWSVGHNLTVRKLPDGSLDIKPIAPCVTVQVATNDQELTDAKAVSFATIFNTWTRVSIHGKNPHALPSEENAWTYNAATDAIVCSVNSETSIGFISPQKYDNYTFEVEVASTSADDDAIGLCVAYLPQDDGTVKSLMLFRQAGSNIGPAIWENSPVPALNLTYQGWRTNGAVPTNAADRDSQGYTVAGTSGNLVFPDGTPIPSGGITTNGLNLGWDKLGAIRLKIVRTPTSITCYTTNKGSVVYDPVNSFTVDLTADPRLKPFQAPASIGFLAHSQPAGTYKSIQQPGLKNDIIDIRDYSVWKWENSQWVKHAMTADTCPFEPGQVVHSPLTKKSYFTNTNLTMFQIGSY